MIINHTLKPRWKEQQEIRKCFVEIENVEVEKSGRLNDTAFGEKPFPCMVTDCSLRFSEKSRVGDHMRIAHGYPKLKCKEEDCDSEFLLYSKLRSHRNTHKTKQIECGECGLRVSKRYLPLHIKFIHQGKRTAECEISGCGKKFISKTNLADHMRSVHGFPKLKCNADQCAAEFISRGGFSRHQKSAHS